MHMAGYDQSAPLACPVFRELVYDRLFAALQLSICQAIIIAEAVKGIWSARAACSGSSSEQGLDDKVKIPRTLN